MKPYFEKKGITLYQADCLEAMRLIPDSSIDACITDPRFNAGKSFANDNLTVGEFESFCRAFVASLTTLRPTNVLVEVGKADNAMRQALDAAFEYQYALCLNYTNSMRNGAVGFANWGLVLWYGGKCYQRYKDRLDATLTSSRDEFTHDSPKMVEHYRHLVRMFTPPDGLVIDPFMGSGTTGVACAIENRRFIGIEIDSYSCEVSAARIKRAQGVACDIPKRIKQYAPTPLFEAVA